MTNSTKPPLWFWIISVLALLWNGAGVFAYVTRAFITDDMIATLPQDQQTEFLMDYPAWYTAAFAFAVFFGALGSLALLFRKKWASFLFFISALGAILQHTYLFINVEDLDLGMPIAIIVVCLFLIWFAKQATTKGWIK